MSKRLFSFAITDDDEPEYFGHLMEEHNIEYYIVPGSVFGFSKPGFWIKKDEDFDKAKQLFIEHEEKFAALAREKYQQQTGYNPNANSNEKFLFWIEFIKNRPKSVLATVIGFGLIIWYFSLFFEMFQS